MKTAKRLLIVLAVALLCLGGWLFYKIEFTNWTVESGILGFVLGWSPYLCLVLSGVCLSGADKMDKTINTRFRLILVAAAADGHISPEEAAVLHQAAKVLGISDRRVKKDFEDLANGTLEYAVPQDEEEKQAVLKCVVAMINVDGKVDEKEVAYILALGERLGYSADYIKSLL